MICVCALLLREIGSRGIPVLISLAFCILLSASFSKLFGIFGELRDMQLFSSAEEILRTAMKVLCVGYLFGISADTCRTLGEEMIAKGVEIGGRVEILLIIFPFFKRILELGAELFV